MTHIEAMKQLEKLADRYFGVTDKKQRNVLTPAITYKDFWKKNAMVKFYTCLDEHGTKFFDNYPQNITCEIETIINETNNSGIRDLILKFELFPGNDFPILETIIPGKDAKIQKEFLDALVSVNELEIWVADNHRNMIAVITSNWDSTLYKEDIDLLYENLPKSPDNPIIDMLRKINSKSSI